MLTIIRNLLQKIIDDTDTGNSNISYKEVLKIIDTIKLFTV